METEHRDLTGHAQSLVKHDREMDCRQNSRLMNRHLLHLLLGRCRVRCSYWFFSSSGRLWRMWFSLISLMATKSLLCARRAVQLEALLKGATRAETFQISMLCDVQSSIFGEQSCISWSEMTNSSVDFFHTLCGHDFCSCGRNALMFAATANDTHGESVCTPCCC